MAHSGEARRERRLLSQIRRANAGDRRLFGEVRAGRAEKGEEAGSAEEPKRKKRPRERAKRAEPAQDISCGQFTFKKEAYRLPTFEVVLNAPQTVALDGTFDVDLLARYFAGGLAAERPVKWRAAQFPHVFTPPGREGFLFSTDARFSGEGKFKSTAVLERDQRTDAGGAARMTFDTTIEPTAQPRRYSIEATVTGDDGIEVRNVQNVIALPPFVLGVKTPALCRTARRGDAGVSSPSTARATRSSASR